jgi:hypothetical protein
MRQAIADVALPLVDPALLGLVASASAGEQADSEVVGQVAGYLSDCSAEDLRRALLAMEFSYEIAELEQAIQGD